MEVGIAWLIFTIPVGVLANAKNRSVISWVALSFFFSPLVGIILLCLPKLPEVVSVLAETPSEEELLELAETPSEEELLEAESKKCSACAESVKLEAIKCRFCGEEFDPGEVESQVAEKRAEIKKLLELEKEREGKKRCPQCGNWDTRWATIEDGGVGHWCDNCKKSLKAMGFA